jgi:hypothetical protein
MKFMHERLPNTCERRASNEIRDAAEPFASSRFFEPELFFRRHANIDLFFTNTTTRRRRWELTLLKHVGDDSSNRLPCLVNTLIRRGAIRKDIRHLYGASHETDVLVRLKDEFVFRSDFTSAFTKMWCAPCTRSNLQPFCSSVLRTVANLTSLGIGRLHRW